MLHPWTPWQGHTSGDLLRDGLKQRAESRTLAHAKDYWYGQGGRNLTSVESVTSVDAAASTSQLDEAESDIV